MTIRDADHDAVLRALVLAITEDSALSEDWSGTTRPTVDVFLESSDVQRLCDVIEARLSDEFLVFPDASVLVRRIAVGLLQGHLILEGPPGTGKTKLAGIISDAFSCSSSMETATADWSAYDVVGGLRPQVVTQDDVTTEVLLPWLGNATRAMYECALVSAEHDLDSDSQPNQAHWLIIDEFSRAEIDKAVGPLYTALSGASRIPLWFGDVQERSEIFVPGRFRIIGTMNSVDTSFVFTFSQGLTRRFQFVHVGVPTEEQLEEEWPNALSQAVRWYDRTYGAAEENEFDVSARVAELSEDDAFRPAIDLAVEFVRWVRYGQESGATVPGWPLGTAQLVDVFKQLVLLKSSGALVDATSAVDLAMADRIAPQMSGLLRSQLDHALSAVLADGPLGSLVRLRRGIELMLQPQNTAFS